MTIRVTIVPGDGIGPEVIGAASRAIEATGVRIDWDRQELGSEAFVRTGDPLPGATLDSIRATRVALKGPVETPPASALRSLNLALRRTLDLYANVRPCRLYEGVPSLYDVVDVVVVRENTEGMYTGIELEMGTPAAEEVIRFVSKTSGVVLPQDSGISVKEITEHGSERIAREYPELGVEDRIIDALCLQLVQAPERFDVLVLPNMYGDLVAELCAGMIGGPAVAPGAHFGDAGGWELAVFEATHGTAPRLAGTDRANPVGALLSGALMLRHVGETASADELEGALVEVLRDGTDVTADLRLADDDRAAVGTAEMTDAVIARL